jgi:AsmA protein
VSLKLGGPAWKPVVTEVDLKGAVASIVKQSATGALGRLFGGRGGAGTEVQKPTDEADKAGKQVEDDLKKRLKGLLGK